MIQDIRYALRILGRNPGFTLVAVLTIALGIGINTTLFSIYNAVALKPLPISDPGRVVRLKRWFENGSMGDIQYYFSYPEYAHLRDHSDVFTGVVASSATTSVLSGDSEKFQAQMVSSNYFTALGVVPELGRTFDPGSDSPRGGSPFLVLSHAFWERRFHGDPHVLGETIRTKDAVFTVIGVVPETFTGTNAYLVPQIPDFWAPLSMQAQLAPGRDWLSDPKDTEFQILGRLKDPVTPAAAQAQIDPLMKQFAATYTPLQKTRTFAFERPTPFGNVDDIGFRLITGALMFAVGLVLLVACANVANMLLALGTARQREIAVRIALGAGRMRIVRQMMTESLILAVAGGLMAVAFSMWCARLLANTLQKALAGSPFDGLTVHLNLSPDLRIFAYALFVSIVTAVMFGLLPSLRVTSHVGHALKDAGGVTRSRLRSLLLAVQVFVSVVFLVGAGLLIRGLVRAEDTSVGYDTRNIFVLQADLGPDPAKAAALRQRMLDQIRILPEIRNAALGTAPLFGTWTPPIVVDGARDRTLASQASDSYFDTMGIDIVRGRPFNNREAASGAPVAVISESTARRFWPGQDPLLKHLKLDLRFTGKYTDFEIVGVARDVRFANPTRIDPAHVYIATSAALPNALLFRTQGDRQSALTAIRKSVETVDENLIRNLAFVNLEQGPLWVHKTMPRVLTFFFGVLGALALCLAGVGIYGVMSYIVSLRLKEIGIRVALGAAGRDVLWMFFLQGMGPVVAGIVAGIAAALALSSIVHSSLAFPGSSDFFHGVPFYDPIAVVGLSLFVATVAAAAGIVPARRALRVDPLIALRHLGE
jgi:predicted permease